MSANKEVEARESHFFDEFAELVDPAQVPVLKMFESGVCPENAFILKWLGDVRGLKILDLGCGAGEAAVFFALQQAEVTAIDISPEILKRAQVVARVHGVSIETGVMSANILDFPDQSFDIVYGANVLHHTDTEAALDEVYRVLRSRGRACFWDPLVHNPIIKIYRRMASGMRTADEHPLSVKDLNLFRKRFSSVTYRTFWLTALWIFVRFYLIERVHPSQEPYWKKIIYDSDRLQGKTKSLFRMDERLLRWFPFLRRYCWNIVVCVNK